MGLKMSRNYDAEILGAEQQKKTAQALRQSAMQAPEGKMIGGWYVPPSWTQYASQALNSYFAAKDEKAAAEAQKEAATAKQEELGKLLRSYGKKEEVKPTDALMNSYAQNMPKGSMVDAAIQGYQQNPPMMTETRQVPLDANEQLAQDVRLQQLAPDAARVLEARQTREDAQAARLEQMRLANELKAAQAQQGGSAYYQPLQTANGVFAFNARTGKVEQVHGPQGQPIVGAQFDPALQGQLSSSKATGHETGKASGEATAKLQDIESQMPQLDKLVSDLSALGQKATYTAAGRARDTTMRELGMDVGEGALARKEYISRVDNEVLPLLRQTFGAAFTEKEGASLRNTLGDPNASPAEKDRVLKSFIQTKKLEVEALARRTGSAVPIASPKVQGGAKFLGFE